MRGESRCVGRGDGLWPAPYNLQPQLRLPSSQLRACPAGPACCSLFLVTALQSRARAGGEVSAYAVLQHAAVLRYGSSLKFAVGEEIGGDLLRPARPLLRGARACWQLLCPARSEQCWGSAAPGHLFLAIADLAPERPDTERTPPLLAARPSAPPTISTAGA